MSCCLWFKRLSMPPSTMKTEPTQKARPPTTFTCLPIEIRAKVMPRANTFHSLRYSHLTLDFRLGGWSWISPVDQGIRNALPRRQLWHYTRPKTLRDQAGNCWLVFPTLSDLSNVQVGGSWRFHSCQYMGRATKHVDKTSLMACGNGQERAQCWVTARSKQFLHAGRSLLSRLRLAGTRHLAAPSGTW